MTDILEKEALKLIDKIDELGGAVSAIEQEFQQNEISKSSFDYQKAIDSGEKILVGVNKFVTKETEIPEIQEIDKIAVQKQLERLNNLKQSRDNNKVNSGLKALKETAENNGNIIPKIINSVKNHTTLGEISDTLRQVFGEY